MRCGVLAHDPTQELKTLHTPHVYQPLDLHEAEVHALLRVAGASPHGLSRRNYALVQLMVHSGVRVSEAAALEARDLGLWMLGTVAALLALYALVEGPPPSWGEARVMCWIGYLISVLGGVPVTYAWSELLFCLLDRHVPRIPEEVKAGRVAASELIWWIAVMVGIFERALITTLVAHDVSGGGSFIAAWVGLKKVSGWQEWSSGTRYARAAAFMALLGNAMSILFGLVGGILCKVAATSPPGG